MIPENSTGERIVGAITGAGEAANDAVVGSYQMIRHPLNTLQGIADLGTEGGSINAMVNISSNYVESRSEFGKNFTNARYVSYGVTSVAIAIAGPKYVRGGKVVRQAGKGGSRAPTFIVSEGGTVFPVPKSATGPIPAISGKGFQFVEGAGGNGLSPRVSGFRFMGPVTRGKYQYPGGYGSYSNRVGQTVNPLTGQTIAPSNPWWHIPAK